MRKKKNQQEGLEKKKDEIGKTRKRVETSEIDKYGCIAAVSVKFK